MPGSPTIVDVPNVGSIEFPAGMDTDDIRAALSQKFPNMPSVKDVRKPSIKDTTSRLTPAQLRAIYAPTPVPYKQEAKDAWVFANKPLIDITPDQIPESVRKTMGAPAQVAAGVGTGAASAVSSLTSPLSIATLGTAGALKSAYPLVSRLMSAGFSGLMGKEAVNEIGETLKLPPKERTPLAVSTHLSNALLSGGMAALSAHDALSRAETKLKASPANILPRAAQAIAEIPKKGTPNASEISPSTALYGDVRSQQESTGQLPVPEGGGGIQPQPQEEKRQVGNKAQVLLKKSTAREAAKEFNALIMEHAVPMKWAQNPDALFSGAEMAGRTDLGKIGIEGKIAQNKAFQAARRQAALDAGLDPEKIGQAAYRAENLDKLKGFIASKMEVNPDLKLAAPESVEQQRERLRAEQIAGEEKRAAQAVQEHAAAKARERLVGDLGSAGQGALFQEPGQAEMFQPPSGEASLSAENRQLIDQTADDYGDQIEYRVPTDESEPFAGQMATIDRKTGKIIINPEQVERWLVRDVPEVDRGKAVASLLGEERIHHAVSDEDALAYLATTTPLEQVASKRIYLGPGGGDISDTDLGHEMIRMRLQQAGRDTMREFIDRSFKERMTVRSLMAISDALRHVREAIGTMASKEGTAIANRIQANVEAAIRARTGGQSSEPGARRKNQDEGQQEFILPSLAGFQQEPLTVDQIASKRENVYRKVPAVLLSDPYSYKLGRFLTEDAGHRPDMTRTATRRLTVLQKAGESSVTAVSTYRDPHTKLAMLAHPGLGDRERIHRPLSQLLAEGYKPVASILLKQPVTNYRRFFPSLDAFEQESGVKLIKPAVPSATGVENRRPVPISQPSQREIGGLTGARAGMLHDHFSAAASKDAAVSAIAHSPNARALVDGIRAVMDDLKTDHPDISPEEAMAKAVEQIYEESQIKNRVEYIRQAESREHEEIAQGHGETEPGMGAEMEGGEEKWGPGAINKYAGIDKFASEDVAPLLKRGVNAFRAARDTIIDALSPASSTAERDVDELFKSKGFKEQVMTRVAGVMDDLGTKFDRMPEKDQIAFADRVKRGLAQPTPELQQTAALIRKWDDYLYKMAKRYNPDLAYKNNHLRVLWKVVPGSPDAIGASKGSILNKRPWQGSKGFLRRSTLADMSEGIALGGVPVTYNPIDLFMLHANDVMRFVAANRAWEGLKKTGSVQFVRMGRKAPEGFSKLDDSIARPYFKTPQGVTAKPGEWWVENGARRMISNYLSLDRFRAGKFGPAGRAMLSAKNATTALELGLSPFHAVFESNEAMSSSLGLGIAKMFSGQLRAGLSDILRMPVAPGQTYQLGKFGSMLARNPAEFQKVYPDAYRWMAAHYPQAKAMISDLFAGGGQIKMNEEYRVGGRNGFIRAVRSGNYPGAVLRAVPALNNLAMKPLFETYIPRLKVGMFLREYAFELQRNSDKLAAGAITRPQLARQTWAFVEDRFGELNWDNLYWNRTFKSAMQLVFRSVTWKLGNLRGFGKAGRDLWSAGIAKALQGEKPMMTLPVAWIIGLSVVTAIQSSIISKVATGKWPWELAGNATDEIKNLIFPRINAQDPTQRVSIPTYFRDGYRLAESIGKDYGVSYARGGMTGEISRLLDDWQNKDFSGRPIYDPNDPWYRKKADEMEHLVPVPFGIANYERTKGSGEADMSALVFTPAPASVESLAESKVRDLALKWMHDSGDARLIDEAKRMATEQNAPGLYSDLRKALKSGNKEAAQTALAHLRKTHTSKQITRAMKAAKDHPFTGSKSNEKKFIESLKQEDFEMYRKAQEDRRQLYRRWLDFAAQQRP